MEKSFVSSNLTGLWHANVIVAVLTLFFTIFPLAIERDPGKAKVYFLISAIAVLFAVAARFKYREFNKNKHINPLLISVLIALYYINIMFFGIYVGILENPAGLAVSFMGFIIVALTLFTVSPLFHLCLTFSAMTAFIIFSVSLKPVYFSTFDIANVLLAAIIAIVFGWHINRYKVLLESERNKFHSQSVIDELTQLKNRRDFTQIFQRYLKNYRSSDDWLCLAIIDIDNFKDYNDYYGHPKGDECLRAVGKVLGEMNDEMNVYAARIGGEEFALLWFEKNQKGVKNVISHLYKAIKDLNIPHEKSKVTPNITVSTGVYVMRCGASDDMHSIYKYADIALYEAKKSGRNCAIVGGEVLDHYKI